MSYRHPPLDTTVVIKDAHVVDGGQTKISTQNLNMEGQLNNALLELKIMNLHLELMDDNHIDRTEVQ